MKKKLSSAEQRVLEAIPEDRTFGKFTFKGQIRPYEIPLKKGEKHNIQTIKNLYRKGLITHGYISFYNCPIILTEKGKKLLNRT